MRFKMLIALSVTAAVATPVKAQQVSVAGGDWSNIPVVISEGKRQPAERVVDDIAAAAQKQSCAAVGRNPRHINLSVPFLVQFDGGGQVQQVVVQRIGCPAVESVIGGALAQLAKEGEYRPTLENRAGWYRGSFDLASN